VVSVASSPALSHVVGFDDFPFTHGRRGDVSVVGTVFAGLRLEGVLRGAVRQDGANATRNLAALVRGSKFADRVQVILLQGIALGGFNAVDIHGLNATLGLPVLVVARRQPNLDAIRDALLTRGVPGGARKWRLIEKAGPMEPAAGVFVQRAGLSLADAGALVSRLAVHGSIPEPLRVAHLIAGAMATGQSRGRT
jgi:endonuclease V-like protein UPF0215 family